MVSAVLQLPLWEDLRLRLIGLVLKSVAIQHLCTFVR